MGGDPRLDPPTVNRSSSTNLSSWTCVYANPPTQLRFDPDEAGLLVLPSTTPVITVTRTLAIVGRPCVHVFGDEEWNSEREYSRLMRIDTPIIILVTRKRTSLRFSKQLATKHLVYDIACVTRCLRIRRRMELPKPGEAILLLNEPTQGLESLNIDTKKA